MKSEYILGILSLLIWDTFACIGAYVLINNFMIKMNCNKLEIIIVYISVILTVYNTSKYVVKHIVNTRDSLNRK